MRSVSPRTLKVTAVMVPEAGDQRIGGRAGQGASAVPSAGLAKGALDQDVVRSLDRMEADVAEIRAELQRLRDLLTQRAIDRMIK